MLIKRKGLYTSLIFDYLNINKNMQKKQIPKYLSSIILQYPEITSGRKNYLEQHQRILRQIKLVKKYFKETDFKL